MNSSHVTLVKQIRGSGAILIVLNKWALCPRYHGNRVSPTVPCNNEFESRHTFKTYTARSSIRDKQLFCKLFCDRHFKRINGVLFWKLKYYTAKPSNYLLNALRQWFRQCVVPPLRYRAHRIISSLEFYFSELSVSFDLRRGCVPGGIDVIGLGVNWSDFIM